jgi:hypothetical protein
MKCVHCCYGLDKGPLFRINHKGESGIWTHSQCQQQTIDPEVQTIVDIIEADKQIKH